MSKGLSTQALVVLLERGLSVEELKSCLTGFKVVRDARPADAWQVGGPGVIIDYRSDVDGFVIVDLVEHKWPDHMGHPEHEPLLFGAWRMGHFGPLTSPGGLQRACEQAWCWEQAARTVASHQAFVRIRLSHILSEDDDAPNAPQDHDPVQDLRFVTAIAQALLKHPATLCLFNPNGEVLLPADQLEEVLASCADNDQPPLEAWCNVRLFNTGEGWLLMDSLGNGQLGIPDQEVAFPIDSLSPARVADFIRDTSLFLLQNGPIIADRHITKGPDGAQWLARTVDQGLSEPPRATLRWLADGRTDVPELFTRERAEPQPVPAEPGEPERKPWWKLW